MIAAAAATAVTLTASTASAAPLPAGPKLAKNLVKAVDVDDAHRHLRAFQRISDTNGGNRAAGQPGYQASVDYVAGKMRDAGFIVRTPEFTYDVEVSDADDVIVDGVTYALTKLDQSPETGDNGVTGTLVAVPQDADGSHGCEAADFAGQDFQGKIALVRRGGCFFEIKHNNAVAAGAIALVVANNAPSVPGGTLGNPGTIPTGMVTQTDGNTLFTKAGQTAKVDLRSHIEPRTEKNVIAQTRTGRTDNVVMAGAHLDAEFGGINDNGTGSAALLEVATRLGSRPKVENAVRFAWWGAEELGLIGSEEYVEDLSFDQRLDIALYLNFDMIGSPNFGHFVYDGDNSDGVGAGPGPLGSAHIEQTFVNYLNTTGTPTEGSDFTGRSDYGPFIAVGIPSGGLFTGAEVPKTPAQVAKWGGTAGVAYDPCYHLACDNLFNVDRGAFERNLKAIAWAVGVYGTSTEDVNGVPPREARAKARAAAALAAKVAAADAHSHAPAA